VHHRRFVDQTVATASAKTPRKSVDRLAPRPAPRPETGGLP
jgi:hypothetical protein